MVLRTVTMTVRMVRLRLCFSHRWESEAAWKNEDRRLAGRLFFFIYSVY